MGCVATEDADAGGAVSALLLCRFTAVLALYCCVAEVTTADADAQTCAADALLVSRRLAH